MKKSASNQIVPMPYAIGDIIDRFGALTITVGASVTAADENATVLFSISHCDTIDGTFEVLKDIWAPKEPLYALVVGIPYIYDMDLSGAKRFVKLSADIVDINTISAEVPAPLTATLTYAAALSDYPYSQNVANKARAALSAQAEDGVMTQSGFRMSTFGLGDVPPLGNEGENTQELEENDTTQAEDGVELIRSFAEANNISVGNATSYNGILKKIEEAGLEYSPQ